MNKIFIALAACMLLSPTTARAHSPNDWFNQGATLIVYNTQKTPMYIHGTGMPISTMAWHHNDWIRKGGRVVQPGKSITFKGLRPGDCYVYTTHTPRWPITESQVRTGNNWYHTRETLRGGKTTHVGR